jgi:transmembrane sensor
MEQSFNILLERYLTGRLTQEERQHFLQQLSVGQYADELNEYIDACMQQNTFGGEEDLAVKELIYQRMKEDVLAETKPEMAADEFASSTHRIHFLKTAWFRYAAAIILIAGLAVAYLLTTNDINAGKKLANDNNHKQTEIPPGGEKAVLTLADGTKIVLDNAANGNLAQQGNAQVVKLANGQIVYNLEGLAEGKVMMNTMSTPKGGQYQLTLPDGTKVWLNAASSITYPAIFVGKERNVKIEGEVYFEVAKDRQKPFIVDIDGKSSVQVLGTSFNINSYENEADIKTTLVEGSVKVIQADQSAILQPGQQAVALSSDQLTRTGSSNKLIVNQADLSKILAWKNGLFNFNGANLREVMRQLERWYDIKVQYEGPISNDVFKGKMYRNVNLSDVLEVLQRMGVKFRMEGKTVIIL